MMLLHSLLIIQANRFDVTASYNGNTDPSGFRKGAGIGTAKEIRDGTPEFEDTGYCGINIHKGSFNSTSSLGSQTIYPPQWDSFIAVAKDQSVRFHGTKWNKAIIPYILLENEGQI
jgi:hypothetical protein